LEFVLAQLKEIGAAYCRKAMMAHPDKGGYGGAMAELS
jgi:curved DNA-binding protein CbpA